APVRLPPTTPRNVAALYQTRTHQSAASPRRHAKAEKLRDNQGSATAGGVYWRYVDKSKSSKPADPGSDTVPPRPNGHSRPLCAACGGRGCAPSAPPIAVDSRFLCL